MDCQNNVQQLLLLLFVGLSQESLLLYQMGDLEQCRQVCEDVCTKANDANSPNYNAIAGKAKSIISGAYKMERDFVKAEEFLDSSTEVHVCLFCPWYNITVYIHLLLCPCKLFHVHFHYCLKTFFVIHVHPANSSILSLRYM